MLRNALPILAALGLVAAAPAFAQAVDQDVQCLVASNVFAGVEKDPQRKQVSVAAAQFFLGRLDARMTVAQLEAKIIAQEKTLNPQNAGAVMTACAKQLQAKQQAMQAMGQDIAKRRAKK